MQKVYILSVACILLMVMISPFIYDIWIGNKMEVPMIMTISVAIYTIIHSWNSLQVIMLNGIGTVKLQTFIIIIGLVYHLPLSLLLGVYIGGYGVIVSMTVITFIYACFFTTQIRRILTQRATSIWIK